MTAGTTALAIVERNADRAMGLELVATDIEAELEWAESQGRADDAARLLEQLQRVHAELASVAEQIPRAA